MRSKVNLTILHGCPPCHKVVHEGNTRLQHEPHSNQPKCEDALPGAGLHSLVHESAGSLALIRVITQFVMSAGPRRPLFTATARSIPQHEVGVDVGIVLM
jgi:hypothetical protein